MQPPRPKSIPKEQNSWVCGIHKNVYIFAWVALLLSVFFFLNILNENLHYSSNPSVLFPELVGFSTSSPVNKTIGKSIAIVPSCPSNSVKSFCLPNYDIFNSYHENRTTTYINFQQMATYLATSFGYGK